MNRFTLSLLCMATFGAIQCKPGHHLIVGGVQSKRGETPWIASLSSRTRGNTHFCGASILDARTILTAAHCVKGLNASSDGLKARIGSLVRDEGGVQYNVSKIIIHPAYGSRSHENDVALLKMASNMSVTRRKRQINGVPVSTVKLPTGDELASGTVVKVAGWGYYMPSGPFLSNLLQVVQVPIVDRRVCSEGYPSITNDMLCAGKAGLDSCSGDSGGPLTKGDVIYGIVSWGAFPCADTIRPGVYSNVVALRDWINANKG